MVFLSSCLVVALAIVLIQSSGQSKTDIKEKPGSYQVAQWYQNNKSASEIRFRGEVDGQIAALGNFANKFLASVGVTTISPFETKVIIEPGMRREEIADILAPKLNWNQAEKNQFARLDPMCYPINSEGKYFPGTYTFKTFLSPIQVELTMQSEFNQRLSSLLAGNISLENDTFAKNALIIASLLQREAAGNGDERIVAGIIWNRLYADMNLQLDATLQYVRGEPGNWWPVPVPADKFIESPYNTYLEPGLPPAPIANPSLDMIVAALNPEPTDCFYYIHADRKLYCSPDYPGHIRNVRRYL